MLQSVGLLGANESIDSLGRGQFWGIVALNALHLYPILYLNVTAALANVDPAMEEAAENLGCTGFRKFRRITLPLIMPRPFRGRHDRLHLRLHRTRRAADLRLHPGHGVPVSTV